MQPRTWPHHQPEEDWSVVPTPSKRSIVFLISASMAPTLTQWSTLPTWVVSSPMMPQSARILTTACPKPVVPLEDCQREYGRVIRSTCPWRSRYRAIVIPTSSMVQRPGFSTRSRTAYLSSFINTVCLHPWHQIPRLRVKRRSPQESQPAQHRVHLASGAAATGLPTS